MNNESLKTLNFIHLALIAALAALKILMNVKSAKNLEFIQTTRSVEFTLDISSPAFLSGERRATKKFVRIFKLFLQNKPNFSQFSNQKRRFHPKTNPIQTQYKANFGPKTSINYENKPKQSQFPKGKNERFFAVPKLNNDNCNFTKVYPKFIPEMLLP